MEKTELILLTRKYINLELDFDVLGKTIKYNPELKYLWVRFNLKLKFKHHAAQNTA